MEPTLIAALVAAAVAALLLLVRPPHRDRDRV